MGWIGVDLDSTLAYCDNSVWGPRPPWPIGPPIQIMVKRINQFLKAGIEVRIFTARVGTLEGEDLLIETENIQNYTLEHIGVKLPVTATKTFDMLRLYDDRVETVIPNTGMTLREALGIA